MRLKVTPILERVDWISVGLTFLFFIVQPEHRLVSFSISLRCSHLIALFGIELCNISKHRKRLVISYLAHNAAFFRRALWLDDLGFLIHS